MLAFWEQHGERERDTPSALHPAFHFGPGMHSGRSFLLYLVIPGPPSGCSLSTSSPALSLPNLLQVSYYLPSSPALYTSGMRPRTRLRIPQRRSAEPLSSPQCGNPFRSGSSTKSTTPQQVKMPRDRSCPPNRAVQPGAPICRARLSRAMHEQMPGNAREKNGRDACWAGVCPIHRREW